MNHYQWSKLDHLKKLNESLLTWMQANIAPIWSLIQMNLLFIIYLIWPNPRSESDIYNPTLDLWFGLSQRFYNNILLNPWSLIKGHFIWKPSLIWSNIPCPGSPVGETDPSKSYFYIYKPCDLKYCIISILPKMNRFNHCNLQ